MVKKVTMIVDGREVVDANNSVDDDRVFIEETRASIRDGNGDYHDKPSYFLRGLVVCILLLCIIFSCVWFGL